jgi:hypothetical protein
MIRFRVLVAVCMALLAAPAYADITGFIGTTTTPNNRLAKGAAVGIGLLVIGFEFEYASTNDDPAQGSPSLKTGMGNVLLQTPGPIFGFACGSITGYSSWEAMRCTHQRIASMQD